MKSLTERLVPAGFTVLLALAACEDDSPGFVMEPEVAESEAAAHVHSPSAFYRVVRAPRGPMQGLGTPRSQMPRYVRFQSEHAKMRFLSEVIGPPRPGGIVGFKRVPESHPNLPFIDVRVGPDGRLRTELVNLANLPSLIRYDWQPAKARRERGGNGWIH